MTKLIQNILSILGYTGSESKLLEIQTVILLFTCIISVAAIILSIITILISHLHQQQNIKLQLFDRRFELYKDLETQIDTVYNYYNSNFSYTYSPTDLHNIPLKDLKLLFQKTLLLFPNTISKNIQKNVHSIELSITSLQNTLAQFNICIRLLEEREYTEFLNEIYLYEKHSENDLLTTEQIESFESSCKKNTISEIYGDDVVETYNYMDIITESRSHLSQLYKSKELLYKQLHDYI